MKTHADGANGDAETRQDPADFHIVALVASRADQGVIVTNAQGCTEWVNDGFTRITGCTLEDLQGRKPDELLKGVDSDHASIDLLQKRIAAGREFNIELVNYAGGDRPEWLSIEACPIQDAEGEIAGSRAVDWEVSTLKAAQAKAQEEVDRRDTFLAMLSHELRNPLSAIKNGLQVLNRSHEFDDEQRANIVQVLKSQVAQMARLLDDLLDVSRFTRNKINIQKKIIDLRATAQYAVSATGPLATQRGCELRVDLPDQPVPICGDAARLQQVQVNLLNNAIRHSDQGDVVSLSLRHDPTGAVITISDTGEGISQEQQARVFDLFFQIDSPRTKSEGGLGVGLSLVREFVAKHDGRVAVHSDGLGKGSTFTVSLPLADQAPEEKRAENTTVSRPMRIVVIEDQRANRYVLKTMLELDGHEVWEAENGTLGLELIQSQQPDVALVDIGLPDITGYEVAQRFRRFDQRHTTLMAALTGYGQESDIRQAKQAGFDVHMVKPLDTDKLAEVLATAAAARDERQR